MMRKQDYGKLQSGQRRNEYGKYGNQVRKQKRMKNRQIHGDKRNESE